MSAQFVNLFMEWLERGITLNVCGVAFNWKKKHMLHQQFCSTLYF